MSERNPDSGQLNDTAALHVLAEALTVYANPEYWYITPADSRYANVQWTGPGSGPSWPDPSAVARQALEKVFGPRARG